MLRTIIVASLGGALEFYDFVAYGIFAADIAPAFFPAGDAFTSLARTFVVFAGGYFVRPLGGIAFSHFGDRFGRRGAFLASLVGMSLATIGMALCPTHATAGAWATGAFVVLRLLQGACLGGELPGAITYVAEAAPRGRTGLACGLLFACASLGVVLASGVGAALHAMLPPDTAARDGWRIALGLGGVIGLATLLPRRALVESPAFALIRARRELERAPLLRVLRRHAGAVATGVGVTAVVAAFNGILFAFLPAYLAQLAGQHAGAIQAAVTAGLATQAVTVLGAGALCDILSPRTVLRLGAIAVMLASAPFFLAVEDPGAGHLAWWLIGYGAAGGLTGGAFAALLAGAFPAPLRFTGVALAYNLAFALFGGLAPLAATSLISITRSLASPAAYVAGAAALSLLATIRWTATPPE